MTEHTAHYVSTTHEDNTVFHDLGKVVENIVSS